MSLKINYLEVHIHMVQCSSQSVNANFFQQYVQPKMLAIEL